jgi:hypothetical protein
VVETDDDSNPVSMSWDEKGKLGWNKDVGVFVGGIGLSDICVGLKDEVGVEVGVTDVGGCVVDASSDMGWVVAWTIGKLVTGAEGVAELCSFDGVDDGVVVNGSVVGLYAGTLVGDAVAASEIGSKLLGGRKGVGVGVTTVFETGNTEIGVFDGDCETGKLVFKCVGTKEIIGVFEVGVPEKIALGAGATDIGASKIGGDELLIAEGVSVTGEIVCATKGVVEIFPIGASNGEGTVVDSVGVKESDCSGDAVEMWVGETDVGDPETGNFVDGTTDVGVADAGFLDTETGDGSSGELVRSNAVGDADNIGASKVGKVETTMGLLDADNGEAENVGDLDNSSTGEFDASGSLLGDVVTCKVFSGAPETCARGSQVG